MGNNSGVVRKKGKGASPVSTKCEIVLSASARALIWTLFWKVSWKWPHLLIFFILFMGRTADNGKEESGFHGRSISVSFALMY